MLDPAVLATPSPARSIPVRRQPARPFARRAVCVLVFSVIGNRPDPPEPSEGVVVDWDLDDRTLGSREAWLDLDRSLGAPSAGRSGLWTTPIDRSDRLAEAGVPHHRIVVEGAGHGFHRTVGDRDLRPEILEFLETTWHDTH